jgi:hypothetical protein
LPDGIGNPSTNQYDAEFDPPVFLMYTRPAFAFLLQGGPMVASMDHAWIGEHRERPRLGMPAGGSLWLFSPVNANQGRLPPLIDFN